MCSAFLSVFLALLLIPCTVAQLTNLTAGGLLSSSCLITSNLYVSAHLRFNVSRSSNSSKLTTTNLIISYILKDDSIPSLNSTSLNSILDMNPIEYFHRGDSIESVSLKGSFVVPNQLDSSSLSYWQLSDISALNSNGPLTVMIWAKLASCPGDWVRLIGKGEWTLRNYGIWIAGGCTYILFQCYGNPGFEFGAQVSIQLNQWMHYAAVIEGGQARIYLNGVLLTTGNAWSSLLKLQQTSSLVTLGYSSFHQPINGWVDGAAFFNRTLTLAQITTAMALTSPAIAFQSFSVNSLNEYRIRSVPSGIYTVRVQPRSTQSRSLYNSNSISFDLDLRNCIQPILTLGSAVVLSGCTTSNYFVGNLTNLTSISNSISRIQTEFYMISYVENTFTSEKQSILSFPEVLFTWFRGFSTVTFDKQISGSNYFNSTLSESVTIPHDYSYSQSISFTIAAWISPTRFSNTANIISKCDSRNQCNFKLSLQSTGEISFNITTFLGVTFSAISPAQITLDSWTHVAAVFSSGLMKLFLNGNLVQSASAGVNIIPFLSQDDLKIACDLSNLQCFDGFIEGVSYLSKSLSVSELLECMQLTHPTNFILQKLKPTDVLNFTTIPKAKSNFIISPFARYNVSLSDYKSVGIRVTSNASTCSKCKAGTYFNTITCIDCPIGTYSSEIGSTFCNLCQPGKYGKEIGLSSCLDCSAGNFNSLSGLTTCSPCQAGLFSQNNGSTHCLQCSLGKWGELNGQSACQNCPKGKNAPITGLTICASCDPGQYQSQPGSPSCNACPLGTYSPTTSSENCSACTAGSTTAIEGSNSILACGCSAGFYGQAFLGQTCIACAQIAGISCFFNDTLPFVEIGYYRDPNNINNAIACIPAEACAETGNTLSTPCSGVYAGLYCGECLDGYYRTGTKCEQCPNEISKWLTITVVVILISLLVYRMASTNTEIPIDLKLAFRSAQLIALYPTLSNRWPSSFSKFLSYLNFTNLDIDVASPECSFNVSYWSRLIFKLCSPFFLIAISILIWFSHQIVLILSARSTNFNASAKLFFNKKIISYSLFLGLNLYTLLISSVISPFECKKQQDGSYLMVNSPSSYCFEAEWMSHYPVIIFFSILWGALFPLTVICILFFYRNKLDDPYFTSTFSQVLTRPYKDGFFWWEIVQITKRASFILIMKLLPLNDLTSEANISASFATCVLLFVFITIDSIFFPYKHLSSSSNSLIWNLVSVIILISNGLIFQSDAIEQSQKNMLGTFLIVLVTSSFAYTFISIIVIRWNSRQERRRKITSSVTKSHRRYSLSSQRPTPSFVLNFSQKSLNTKSSAVLEGEMQLLFTEKEVVLDEQQKVLISSNLSTWFRSIQSVLMDNHVALSVTFDKETKKDNSSKENSVETDGERQNPTVSSF